VNRLVTLCLLASLCIQSAICQTEALTIGDTIYRYSTTYFDPISKLEEIRFSQFEFACVERFKIDSSDVPRTAYKFNSSRGYEELLGRDEDILTYKGFVGKDPYFEVPNTYVQFIGQIPLINLVDPRSFNLEGEASFYLEYKVEELPEALQNWLVFQDFQKLRLQVAVNYKTKYRGRTSQDEKVHKLKTQYSLSIADVSAKKDRWSSVKLPKELKDQYFQRKVYKYQSLIEEGRGYERIRLYEMPFQKVVFQFDEGVRSTADCQYEGEKIYVFPNPTYGDLNIAFSNLAAGQYSFELYSIVGKEIWSQTIDLEDNEGEIKLDLPYLNKGLYLYCIIKEDGRFLQSRRLVVVEP